MTTPTFTWIPSRADLAKKPNLFTAKFGDGYRQDIPNGINNNPQVWSVVFNTSATTSDAIMAFLDALNGSPMYWTPPRGASILGFKCTDYRQTNAPGQFTVTATFEQAYGY